MMQGKTLVLVLGAVMFSVVGQLFLKSGAQRVTAPVMLTLSTGQAATPTIGAP